MEHVGGGNFYSSARFRLIGGLIGKGTVDWFAGCSAVLMACRYCGVETHGENHGRMAECLDALRAETQRLSAQLAEKHRPAGDAEPMNRTKSVSAECQVAGEFSTRDRARMLR
jgi:hypothetical protein